MVKLIRLTTQDPNGYYNNEFHSELIIPANSKIALHSLTAEINTESITIDAQNDNIQFKMQKTEEEFRSIHIENGFYNSSNFNSLFSDITVKMNKLMQYSQNEIGRQWRVGVNTNKKAMFENTFGENIQPTAVANSKIGTLNVITESTARVDKTHRSGGTAGNYDSFLYIKSPQCKGSSSLRAKVFNVNTKNCIIGYTSAPQNTNTASIDISTIKYGIKLNADGINYSYIKDGVITPTTTPRNANDYFSIDTVNSQIKLNIYRDSVGTISLNTYNYDHITDLFPVVIFLGDSTSILSNIQFSSDPFYNIINATTDAPELTVSIPTIAKNPTVRVLKFMDVDLAKFLGFKQTSYESDFILNIDFTAFYAFQPADFSDSFVIELLNLNVDSYDGLTKERRNFLHTIVQADIVRNRLTYTAPYLLFLDMKNSQPLSLRQIKARMLKEDLSQVNLTGISQITLIVE